MSCIGNVPGCGCPPGQLIDEDRNSCVHPYDCQGMIIIIYIYLLLLLPYSHIIIYRKESMSPMVVIILLGIYQ